MRTLARFGLFLIVIASVSAVCTGSSQARIELSYCYTPPRSPYLLVRNATCREGKSAVHRIFQSKSAIDRLPYVLSVDEWTCRISKGVNNAAEHSIRCRRSDAGLIWSGIRLQR
jgi:hypothetical protein